MGWIARYAGDLKKLGAKGPCRDIEGLQGDDGGPLYGFCSGQAAKLQSWSYSEYLAFLTSSYSHFAGQTNFESRCVIGISGVVRDTCYACEVQALRR